jgi:hypothetical protein
MGAQEATQGSGLSLRVTACAMAFSNAEGRFSAQLGASSRRLRIKPLGTCSVAEVLQAQGGRRHPRGLRLKAVRVSPHDVQVRLKGSAETPLTAQGIGSLEPIGGFGHRHRRLERWLCSGGGRYSA